MRVFAFGHMGWPNAVHPLDPMSKGLWGTLWPNSQTLTPHSHLSRPRGAKSTHFHSSKNMCPTPQYLAQEGEMGAPGGGLKQCARWQGQDRTSGGSPPMPKATFPFVTARQWVDGWRLFFLNTATVSAGHSRPCGRISHVWPAAARLGREAQPAVQ